VSTISLGHNLVLSLALRANKNEHSLRQCAIVTGAHAEQGRVEFEHETTPVETRAGPAKHANGAIPRRKEAAQSVYETTIGLQETNG
jgi:hypothetical protein